MFTELEAFYYRSIKKLLRIKTNVKKSLFLQVVMGMKFSEYQKAALITLRKTASQQEIEIATNQLREAMATVQQWCSLRSSILLKWRLGVAFPPRLPNPKEALICFCRHRLTDGHIEICEAIQSFINKIAFPVTLTQLRRQVSVNVLLEPLTQLQETTRVLQKVKSETIKKLKVTLGQAQIDRYMRPV